jgi:uncharacterized membrane protein YhaH (DUF805 family)
MVFFNAGVDINGRATFAVSPQVWYYVVVTIPLTILVFIVWALWLRHQRLVDKNYKGKIALSDGIPIANQPESTRHYVNSM